MWCWGSKPKPGPNANGFASQWNIGLKLFFSGEVFHLYGIETKGVSQAGVQSLVYTYQLSYGLPNSDLTLYSEGDGTKVRSYIQHIFIDPKKAFDTVNHKILLGKLDRIGIQNINLQWIQNYKSVAKYFSKWFIIY